SCLRAPRGLAVAETAKMRAEFHHPLRIDLRHRPREELRRLHDLAGHDPERLTRIVGGLRGLGITRAFLLALPPLVEAGAGEERDLAIARGFVEIALLFLRHLAEQAGEDGAMDR